MLLPSLILTAILGASPAARATVVLVKLGDFPEPLTQVIAASLADELQVRVVRHADVPLPRTAYYPPRRRYRADNLLESLAAELKDLPTGTRVLGLTAVDISTTKGNIVDWGVFGLGNLGGPACVVSTFRLRRLPAHASRPDLLRFRVVSVAVHEVGHTLGLEHCAEPRCVMQDAVGTIRSVDESTGQLGAECRARMERGVPLFLPRER